MAEVDTAQIEKAVTDIVNDAHKDGSIDELTPRMIRSRAEERLGLEGGTLDAWKDVVKRAATRAIDALDEDAASSATASASEEEEVKPAESAPKSKPKPMAAPSNAKRKSAKKDDDNEGTPPSKKPRVSSTTKKATVKKDAKEVGMKNGKVVRSASVIPSSDEDDQESPKPASSKSPGKDSKSPGKDSKSPGKDSKSKGKEKPKRPPLPKNTSAHDADVSTAEVGDGDVEAGAKPHSKSKGKSKLSEEVTGVKADGEEGAESVTVDDESVTAEGGGGEEGKEEAGEGAGEAEGGKSESESEMSVLIDEEPKKSRSKGKSRKASGETKSKSKSTAKGSESKKESGSKKGKAKKDTGDETPEDTEIKRLKSFIVACGVRKLWSREFSSAGIPPLPSTSTSSNPSASHAGSTPSQVREIKLAQIRHLKGMLKELGMEGRLSMEKARRVRERRELARELEDVQTFEKAVVHGTSTRSSRSSHHKSGAGAATSGGNESDVEDALDDRKKGGEGDSEEEEVVGKSRRKVNARQSIMAFLGDQSESE